jgi:hypothetical protein
MKRFTSVLLPHLKEPGDEREVRKMGLDLLETVNAAARPVWGDEAGGNVSTFEDTGFYVAKGSAVFWDDIMFSPTSFKGGVTDPPTFAAITGTIYGWRFDAATGQAIHGSFEVPHSYKQYTDLEFHIHWCPTTTNTGNIVWGIEYTVADIGVVLSAARTVSIVPLAAPGVVNKHILTDIVSIPGTRIGAVVSYRLFRQNGGTDTFTGNAFLLSVGVHYQSDTLGSRQEFSK